MNKILNINDVVQWNIDTERLIKTYCGFYDKNDIDLDIIYLLLKDVMQNPDSESANNFNNIIKFLSVMPVIFAKYCVYNRSNLRDNLGFLFFHNTIDNTTFKKELDKVFKDEFSKIDEIPKGYQIINGISNDDLSDKNKIAIISLDFRYLDLFNHPSYIVCNTAALEYIRTYENCARLDRYSNIGNFLKSDTDPFLKTILNNCSEENKGKILNIEGRLIKFVDNPSEELQEIAFNDDARNVLFFDDLEENIYYRFIKIKPYIVSYLNRRTPEMIQMAIQVDASVILFLPEKDESYQLLAADYIDISQGFYVGKTEKSIMEFLLESDWLVPSFLTKIEHMSKYSKYKDSIRSHKNYVGLAQTILNKIEGKDE